MTNQELIEQSIIEPFRYRFLFNIPSHEKFGTETEMEGIDVFSAKKVIHNIVDRNWEVKYEDSLDVNSLELASPPMQNQKEIWQLLLTLGEALQSLSPTFKHASFQVNLDNHLSNEQLLWLLKFFATYEDIIYRFSRGTDSCFRDTLLEYACPIAPFLKTIDSKNDFALKQEFQDYKHFALNFKTKKVICQFEGEFNVGRALESIFASPILLIEFRTPNGTVNPILWQNYINTFYHLLAFIQSSSFDLGKVEYEWKITEYINISTYEKMNLNKALTFANLIFKEDIDKIYFLKQYMGNDSKKVKQYKIES